MLLVPQQIKNFINESEELKENSTVSPYVRIPETIKIVPDLEEKKKVKKLISAGYTKNCVICGTVYHDEDDWCDYCQDYLFESLKDVLAKKCVKRTVKPTYIHEIPIHVFKEFNMKYCECTLDDGSIMRKWCGAAEYECHVELQELKEFKSPWYKVFRCEANSPYSCIKGERKQDYMIVIFKPSASEEKEHENEYMNKWVKW